LEKDSSGRDIIEDPILAFAWRDWGKPQKNLSQDGRSSGIL
jgi:hypothetical protein